MGSLVEYKNGVYKSKDATYFVKGDKFVMRRGGRLYKTTRHFMFGRFVEPLPKNIDKAIDQWYDDLPGW